MSPALNVFRTVFKCEPSSISTENMAAADISMSDELRRFTGLQLLRRIALLRRFNVCVQQFFSSSYQVLIFDDVSLDATVLGRLSKWRHLLNEDIVGHVSIPAAVGAFFFASMCYNNVLGFLGSLHRV